jgi:hypothetical protein
MYLDRCATTVVDVDMYRVSVPALRRWVFVSRNEANTAIRPRVVVAYTSDGYLRDAYRWITGTDGSLIAVDQGAWRLEGIRMCTSHRLDRRTSNSASSFISTRTDPNRRAGVRLINSHCLTIGE